MLFQRGENILSAVLCGLDSMLLPCRAPRFGGKLFVAHLNPQLPRRAGAADERFVQKLAAALGLPFRAGRGAVKTFAQHRGWVVLVLLMAAQCASALPVPNPSFEEAGGGRPLGWTFSGPKAAIPGVWTTEKPFAGKRAIRIDGRHGSLQWESSPVPALPERQYLLRWQTRFLGEKGWRFRADFCGPEVAFQDARGHVLSSARQHTSCWQTSGWRPGWFLFTTPPATEALALRFAIETKEPLPGGFDVDTVELDEWPPTPPAASADACLLSMKIEDENGRPVAARVRIANGKAEPVRPPGAIAYERIGGAFHPLEEGACHALVPRGLYSIMVTRGFEYEPWERVVNAATENLVLTVRLERNWDWRERGWFAGDHHTHLHRHGGSLFPTLGWPDALRAARSEGLDFLPFMGADHYPEETKLTAREPHSHDFVYELTDEITEDFWGHACPIGASADSRRDPRYDTGPMNFDRYAAIAGSGGVLSYGHPYGPLEGDDDLMAVATPGMGHVAREFPVDLALGMPCAIDLLAMEGPRNQLEHKLHDLYRLWNLGFRPAVAASTDFHVDQGRQPIGSVRTYVRSGSLEMTAIAQAYCAGRTFATSGPLLDLSVAGAKPGDEVRFASQAERLLVKVEAVSIGRLQRVEIVVNGEVFRTFTAEDPHRIAAACEVPTARSLWIAARAYGPEDRHLASDLEGKSLGTGQFAHTSPVYVLVAGQPISVGKSADAEYFVRWCDAVLAGWRRHIATSPDQERHEAVVTERLARARGVFTQLAGNAH
jgi:hypothetical protein